jgi:hypothetical protein
MSFIAQTPQPSLAWQFEGFTAPYIGSVGSTTVNGTLTYGTGIYGQDLILNGASNIIYNLTNQIVLDTGFSICFWLKPLSTPAGGAWIYDISATNYGDRIYANFQTNRYISFNYIGYVYSPVALTLGTWYHICLTFGNGNMILYWNGAYSTALAQDTTNVTLANKFSIASLVSGQGPNINAEMDDLRIYNTALSAAQVKAVYATQGMPSRGVRFHRFLNPVWHGSLNPQTWIL